MRFLVDECTGPAVANWLGQRGHDVFSVYDEARGLADDAILVQAVSEGRVIITADKDFGDMIYRDQKPHTGVVLLRLHDERAAAKIAVLQRFLDQYQGDLAQLSARFIVLTQGSIRIAAPWVG